MADVTSSARLIVLLSLVLISCSNIGSSSVNQETFEGSSFKCNESLISISGCFDPFGNECIDSICSCRPNFPIRVIQDKDTGSSICLSDLPMLNDLCWISQQCSVPHSHCVRIVSGRKLDDIISPLWEPYVKSGGNLKFIPGRCSCLKKFRKTLVYDSEANAIKEGCVKRNLGTRCRTNYECSSRSKYTSCNESMICVCSPGTEYDEQDDECYFPKHDPVVESCIGNKTWECALDSRLQNLKNLGGFALFLILFLLLWKICCLEEYCGGEKRRASEFIVAYRRQSEGTENEFVFPDDEPPPSYDAVANSGSERSQGYIPAYKTTVNKQPV